MVQPIEIPAPLAGDSETVITALEMAAVFAGKGDNAEALRWLKRAVDSASESGDDARTLLLARTAAELNHQAHAPSSDGSAAPEAARATPAEPAAQRALPKPPLKSNPARSSSDGPPEATPLPLSRPSLRAAAPSASPSAPSGRPPPPSARVSSLPSAPRHSSAPVRSTASTTPEPPRVSTLAGFASPEPRVSQPPAVTSTPSRSATLRQFPAVRAPAPADDSETTAPGGPAPPAIAEARGTPTPPAVQEASAATWLRSAARVSVTAQPSEPGAYRVRVLADGEAAADGAAEAYLVLVDPRTALFRTPR